MDKLQIIIPTIILVQLCLLFLLHNNKYTYLIAKKKLLYVNILGYENKYLNKKPKCNAHLQMLLHLL